MPLFVDDAATQVLGVRTFLLQSLIQHIKAWNLSQVEAAKRLGMTGPRLNDLLQGKSHLFAVDGLMRIADKAGLKVTFNFD